MKIKSNAVICVLSLLLASCASMTTNHEDLTLSVDTDSISTASAFGYQKIEISTFEPGGFCQDSFASKLGRALFNKGQKSVMTLMLDNNPISVFVYDKSSNTCTKDMGSYLVYSGFERIDLASNNKHTVKLAYIDEHQVSGFQTALGFASTVAALPSASQEVSRILTAGIDNALAKSLSGNTTISHSFFMPSNGRKVFNVTAAIKGSPYKIAQFEVIEKESMFDEATIKNGVMSMHLMDERTINKQLEERRKINDRSLISGDAAVAKWDCDYLTGRYSDLLTLHDMKKLREHYLIESHVNIVSPELLAACKLPNVPSELATSLKVTLENYYVSADANRGTQFMNDFINAPAADAPILSKKWSYAPEGFAYVNAGQLLEAGLQQPPGCFSFSRKDRNTFYFSLPVKQKTYYFIAQLDRSYTKEEEAAGKRSSILSLGVTDLFQNAGAGEYQEQKKTCGPVQALAEG